MIKASNSITDNSLNCWAASTCAAAAVGGDIVASVNFLQAGLLLLAKVATTLGVMDDAHALPTDLAECHRLLLAAFQQAAELSRVLEETAASYEELQATHQAALEELSALKRWIYGRRTEKLVEGEGQRHLFDLEHFSTSAPPLEPRPELPRPSHRRVAVAENSTSTSCRTFGTSMT